MAAGTTRQRAVHAPLDEHGSQAPQSPLIPQFGPLSRPGPRPAARVCTTPPPRHHIRHSDVKGAAERVTLAATPLQRAVRQTNARHAGRNTPPRHIGHAPFPGASCRPRKGARPGSPIRCCRSAPPGPPHQRGEGADFPAAVVRYQFVFFFVRYQLCPCAHRHVALLQHSRG